MTEPVKIGDNVTLYLGDCLDVMRDMPAGSVDAVIADPPYPQEFIHLYGAAAQASARVLSDGGLFAVMAGQSYLPQLMEDIGQYLEYRWTACYLMLSGQAVQIWPRRVIAFWKPVLVYSKGPHPRKWFGDVINHKTNDGKALHKWQQGINGTRDWVERMTGPEATVLDPFMGSGTTGVACVQTGRNFIGIEIDPTYFAIAEKRIREAMMQPTLEGIR